MLPGKIVTSSELETEKGTVLSASRESHICIYARPSKFLVSCVFVEHKLKPAIRASRCSSSFGSNNRRNRHKAASEQALKSKLSSAHSVVL